MRAFALGLIFSAIAVPCLAQTVLKSEPLVLAPYEIAFVQDAVLSGRQGAQGDRRDPRAEPQEGLRHAGFGAGVAGERDTVSAAPGVNAGLDHGSLSWLMAYRVPDRSAGRIAPQSGGTPHLGIQLQFQPGIALGLGLVLPGPRSDPAGMA